MAAIVLVHGAWVGGWRYRRPTAAHNAPVAAPRQTADVLQSPV